MPFLKDAFNTGTKMQQDRLIISFIRHMNRLPINQVEEFLETKKSCQSSHKKGYVVSCAGSRTCCPQPWIGRDQCRTRYLRYFNQIKFYFN